MSDRAAVISMAVLLFVAIAAGCGTSDGADAAAGADGGQAGGDTGAAEDSGAPPDAGEQDVGAPVDSGEPDVGEQVDAGEQDTGAPVDAGEADVGTPVDAGPVDAGSPAHACIKGGSAVAATAVTVKNFSFDPPCIKVARGTKVTWTNAGMASHTVTSDPGGVATFDSGALGTAGTFELTFDTAGGVDYHCVPHKGSGMQGTVIVE